MRRMVVETLALALVLAGASIGLAQPTGSPPKRTVILVEEENLPKAKTTPGKSTLEELLAEALRNNPDIRVAVAKLAEAEAELNRARLQVPQKVIALHHALTSQKAEVVFRQAQYDRFKKLEEKKAIETQLVDEQRQRLTLAKAKLAELESQMPALLGKMTQAAERGILRPTMVPGTDYGNSRMSMTADLVRNDLALRRQALNYEADLIIHLQRKLEGPLAERIRKALETPITVDYKNMIVSAILKDLQKKVPGLSFRPISPSGDRQVTLQFEEALPVSAILQALADEIGYIFLVREYGIVAMSRSDVPPGAMTVEQFLRQAKAPADKK